MSRNQTLKKYHLSVFYVSYTYFMVHIKHMRVTNILSSQWGVGTLYHSIYPYDES